MHDWDFKSEFSIEPKLITDEIPYRYDFSPYFSISVVWKPMNMFKTQIEDEDGKITLNPWRIHINTCNIFMVDNSYTIVVPYTDLLYKVCGSNDSNLCLIENYLGVPIYIRGNEISISSSDDDVIQSFKHIFNRILDEVSDGTEPCVDMVKSIQYKTWNHKQ